MPGKSDCVANVSLSPAALAAMGNDLLKLLMLSKDKKYVNNLWENKSGFEFVSRLKCLFGETRRVRKHQIKLNKIIQKLT